MVTVKNPLGGGSGESASIFVSGLSSTDTVTATTPSGGSKNPTWVSAESEWQFTGLTEYGNYTITATNGSQTATATVLVDGAEEYEITMSLVTIAKLITTKPTSNTIDIGTITESADYYGTNSSWGAWGDSTGARWLTTNGQLPAWTQLTLNDTYYIDRIELYTSRGEYCQTGSGYFTDSSGETYDYTMPDATLVTITVQAWVTSIRLTATVRNSTYGSEGADIRSIQLYGGK